MKDINNKSYLNMKVCIRKKETEDGEMKKEKKNLEGREVEEE